MELTFWSRLRLGLIRRMRTHYKAIPIFGVEEDEIPLFHVCI